eukprot:Hpha_TRINITY_DN15717_c2_g2::TRINITY_DN15717_c2_g2_i1::g.36623::m.36623
MDKDIKRQFTPVVCCTLVIAVVSLVQQWPPLPSELSILTVYGVILSALGFLLMTLIDRFPMRYVLDVMCLFGVLGIIGTDLSNSARLQSSSWGLIIVILDGAIAFERPHLLKVTLGLALVFKAIERLESGARLGIYEAQFWDGSSWVVDACNCAVPPCSVGMLSAVRAYATIVFVLLLDTYLTRSFAAGMRAQLEAVDASVLVAGRVASALARYDTGSAADAIEEDGRLMPQALRVSLERLLTNLTEYKAYLPDSLLEEGEERVQNVPPPGMGCDEAFATLVFTDIQSSTLLWEAHSLGMQQALQIHNTLLRAAATEYGGYECKVIGDAFFLAFSSVMKAVDFGLDAQTRLVASDWPPDVLSHPLCETTDGPGGSVIWHGLRVRIGIHCGKVRPERNPVSGRMDYFGPTVNIAARVEAALKFGGLTGVTADVLNEVGDQLRSRGDVDIFRMDSVPLKGVSDPVEISVVLPQTLSGRWAATRQVEIIQPVALSRTSSIRSSLRSSLSEVEGNSRLALRLRQAMGAACTVRSCLRKRGRTAEVELSEALAFVEVCAARTQGMVIAVISVQCVVSWQASLRCPDHLSQCCHFIGLAGQQPSRQKTAHCGATSGKVLHGNVMARRRRHATVVGSCVELGMTLAEEAELKGVRALVAGEVGEHCLRLAMTSRSVAWEDECGRTVLIWAIERQDRYERAHTEAEMSVQTVDEGESAQVAGPSRRFVRSFGFNGSGSGSSLSGAMDTAGTACINALNTPSIFSLPVESDSMIPFVRV